MRKFIKHVMLFVLPILFGVIYFEWQLRNIPNDYKYKSTYLGKNANKIEVLFLGSSHIYFGINPKYVKCNAFNASHISQSLNYDLAILKKYENNFESLKFIILPVDYFSLYTSIEKGIESWRVKNYNIYYNIATPFTWDNFETFNTKVPVNVSRLNSFIKNNTTDVTCDYLGFGTTYKSEKSLNLVETGILAAQRHTVKLENDIYNDNIESIKSIIKLAKKHNSKIIFITAPSYKSYVQNLEPNQLVTTIQAIKMISSKSANTSYYNFLADSSFKDGDFYDGDHLNEIGAKKLTLKIDSIINTQSDKNFERMP